MYPTAYLKDYGVWFDGYSNEDVVLFDEVNKKVAQDLKQHIKRWADSYPHNL